MTIIGTVAKQANGSFKGELHTLTIRAELDIVPNRGSSSAIQPHYRVTANGVEIGAGWVRRRDVSGEHYVSLSLATPEFGPRRLYANLAPAAGRNDAFVIIWTPAD